MTIQTPRRRLVVGLFGLALVGSACGSGTEGVEAADAWARPSPMMADAAAVYMTLSSEDGATIASVSVPSDIAGRAEIHETVAMDDMMTNDERMADEEAMDDEMDESMEDGDHEDGEHMGDTAMMMQELEDGLLIPAGDEVVLEPGGLHVMLLDLPEPLEEGDTFDVTFTEDDGEEFTVSVEVRSEAP